MVRRSSKGPRTCDREDSDPPIVAEFSAKLNGIGWKSRSEAVPSALEEDERGDDGGAHEEREDDVLVMRPRRVEEVVYGEKVDVVQHNQEGGPVGPEQDEDRDDRMGSRESRLRRTNRMCPLNLSNEPMAGPEISGL